MEISTMFYKHCGPTKFCFQENVFGVIVRRVNTMLIQLISMRSNKQRYAQPEKPLLSRGFINPGNE